MFPELLENIADKADSLTEKAAATTKTVREILDAMDGEPAESKTPALDAQRAEQEQGRAVGVHVVEDTLRDRIAVQQANVEDGIKKAIMKPTETLLRPRNR